MARNHSYGRARRQCGPPAYLRRCACPRGSWAISGRWVGPLQRIFLYQRGGLSATTRSEALVQARHLVDGSRVQQREGGFVTYHALVFEDHQIIYAEGVPVESLLVSRATVARLPDDSRRTLSARFPQLNQRAHFAQELSQEPLLDTG